MDSLWQDARLGVRTLLKAPLFTTGRCPDARSGHRRQCGGLHDRQPAAAQAAVGIAAALSVTHLLANLLFSVSPVDPATFIEVPLLLGVMAIAASYVPAFRATRIDPAVALRGE